MRLRTFHLKMPLLRLRTVLILIDVLILALPLGGAALLHVYQNALIRQTEEDLIAQGAYIQSIYLAALRQTGGVSIAQGSLETPSGFDTTQPVLAFGRNHILPPRPDGVPAAMPANPLAVRAGATAMPVVEAATRLTLAGVRIVDPSGIVVSGRDELGQSLAGVPEVATALTGHYASALRERVSAHPAPPLGSISRGGRVRVFVAIPTIQGGTLYGAVLLSRVAPDILESLYRNRVAVAAMVLLAAGVTGALALLTLMTIGQPIKALTTQAARIGRAEPDVPVLRHAGTIEVARLSLTLRDMAHGMAECAAYIRDFALHVSHEFKTPLTSIRGAMELIQEHGPAMPPEFMARLLANTVADTVRLETLLAQLLALARADMTRNQPGSCMVRAVLDRLEARYAQAGLAIVSRGGEAAEAVPVEGEILEAVLTHLFDNSLQHGANRIDVRLEADRLVVTDNGSGISAANAARLFEPFFTTRRGEGGTGLGLPIVRSMLAASGATISYEMAESGARFAIAFKPQAEIET